MREEAASGDTRLRMLGSAIACCTNSGPRPSISTRPVRSAIDRSAIAAVCRTYELRPDEDGQERERERRASCGLWIPKSDKYRRTALNPVDGIWPGYESADARWSASWIQ